MKKTLVLLFHFAALTIYAQKGDTLSVGPDNLKLNNLNFGNQWYLIYFKKTKDSPANGMTLVKINVQRQVENGKPVTAVTQQWDKDTVVHTAVTRFDAKTFSTLTHNTFWKRLDYTGNFDFVKRQASVKGKMADSLKTRSVNDFNDSFSKYNLNWHSDLVIFPLLPFKENRVFKINFYDPGASKAKEVFYHVEGSEQLSSSTGKIDCWVLVIRHTKPFASSQKFWISKKSNEILKEEDEFGGQYRYKLKLAVAEND
jgi:hypothetical protein